MEEDSGSNTSRGLSYETPPTDTPLPPPTPQCTVSEWPTTCSSLHYLYMYVCTHV